MDTKQIWRSGAAAVAGGVMLVAAALLAVGGRTDDAVTLALTGAGLLLAGLSGAVKPRTRDDKGEADGDG